MRRMELLFALAAVPVLSCQSFVQHAGYTLASRAADAGDLPKAVAELDTILRENPSDKRAVIMRATYKKKLGDMDGAITDYTRYIELDPYEAVMYVHRAECRMQQLKPTSLSAERATEAARRGIAPELMADFTRAIERDPKMSRAYGQRALLQLAVGDAAAAEKDVAAFNKLEPSGGNRKAFDEQLAAARAMHVGVAPAGR